jgi:hypothetical protein
VWFDRFEWIQAIMAICLYLCIFEQKFYICSCATSKPSNEFVNGCFGRREQTYPEPRTVGYQGISVLCSNDEIYFVTFVSSSYYLLNVTFFGFWLKQW